MLLPGPKLLLREKLLVEPDALVSPLVAEVGQHVLGQLRVLEAWITLDALPLFVEGDDDGKQLGAEVEVGGEVYRAIIVLEHVLDQGYLDHFLVLAVQPFSEPVAFGDLRHPV